MHFAAALTGCPRMALTLSVWPSGGLIDQSIHSLVGVEQCNELIVALVRVHGTSQLFPDELFGGRDEPLVTLVHRPAFDPFGLHQSGRDEDAHAFAQRRCRDTELFGDQDSADAISDEVPIDLRWEVSTRVPAADSLLTDLSWSFGCPSESQRTKGPALR
jgi:hypothetical protein